MLDHFNPENGRIEHFNIKGTDVELNLAKNPAGFNQNINAVMADPKDKDVIILINDRDQDGNDVSWLWDVDFDRFKDESIKSITVSGIRCQDLRLSCVHGAAGTQKHVCDKGLFLFFSVDDGQ